jgi:hypothetical protein
LSAVASGRAVVDRLARARDDADERPVHSERTAAVLGMALGVSFATCFVTGLASHFAQHPVSWAPWPARPAGLYRVTQGLHVATGLAAVPLLLAKLWSVFPHLFRWPPVQSVAHAVERLMLVPLVAGSVFLLFSGTANVMHWYPWRFSFPRTHYGMAWVTVGALVTHVAAKRAATAAVLRRRPPADPSPGADEEVAAGGTVMSRRAYLGWTGAAAGLVTLVTVGQTVRPLRRLALLAPRRPDIGPQGLPVNGVPNAAVVAFGASDAYRFRIHGDVATEVVLTLDELRALPRHEAVLPIACVEGWSAEARWAGVPVGELLRRAGVADDEPVHLRFESFQTGTAYRYSEMDDRLARDPDTLIAWELNGDPLHPHHGYPARLIAPNRPGVLQTKWVEAIRVTRS